MAVSMSPRDCSNNAYMLSARGSPARTASAASSKSRAASELSEPLALIAAWQYI
jgi:hypothetical protein